MWTVGFVLSGLGRILGSVHLMTTITLMPTEMRDGKPGCRTTSGRVIKLRGGSWFWSRRAG
jgi:hypothetical protein